MPSNRSPTPTLNASPGFSPSAPAAVALASSNACFTAASDLGAICLTVVSPTSISKRLSTAPAP